MRAAVMSAPGQVAVREIDRPAARAGEAVVEVHRVGICGTDLHVLAGEHRSVVFPVIAGHEFMGRVVELGEGAAGVEVGDLVAVDPMVFCGSCSSCRDGWANLCENGGGLGTTRDGAFAEYVAVSAAQCQRLPDGLPAAWGILAEPLACALHAVDGVGSVLGTRALVLGAGPMGLLLTRLLVAGGAEVSVVERNDTRLALAPAFGVHRSETSLAAFGDERWDIVMDATGNPHVIADGLRRVRRAGVFAFVGLAPESAEIPLSGYDVVMKQLTIVGSNSVRHTFGRAVELLASGTIPAELLLEEPVGLDRIEEAFASTRRGIGGKHSVTPASAGQGVAR